MDPSAGLPDAARAALSRIHHETRAEADRLLADVRGGGPQALLAVAQAALAHVESVVLGLRDATQAQTACAAGCSFCCWMNIDAPAHEILLIARWVRTTWSPWDVEDLAREAAARAAERAGMDHAERQRRRRPCLLLKDAMCSVYPVRPGACRRYLSGDLEACESLWADPSAEAAVEFPLLREAGRAAGTAVHHAFVRAGCDGRWYDLPSALAEALTDPECEARWAAGDRVFSEAAETRTPQGFSQDAALAALRDRLAAE